MGRPLLPYWYLNPPSPTRAFQCEQGYGCFHSIFYDLRKFHAELILVDGDRKKVKKTTIQARNVPQTIKVQR
jgi:hypothetical protein